MSLATRGLDLLNRFLPVTHGVTGGATYTRVLSTGNVIITEVPATFGRTLFNLQTRNGNSAIEWGERDYIIEALRIATLGEPKQGDLISHDGVIFEVSRPGGSSSEPYYRFSDNNHTQYRIHTKRVT